MAASTLLKKFGLMPKINDLDFVVGLRIKLMLEKFEKIANRSPFVEYYGDFNGRSNHFGYAITADGQYEYAQLVLSGACRRRVGGDRRRETANRPAGLRPDLFLASDSV